MILEEFLYETFLLIFNLLKINNTHCIFTFIINKQKKVKILTKHNLPRMQFSLCSHQHLKINLANLLNT